MLCYLKPLTAAVPAEMRLTHEAWSLQGMSTHKKSMFLQLSVAWLITTKSFVQLSSNMGSSEFSQFHRGL